MVTKFSRRILFLLSLFVGMEQRRLRFPCGKIAPLFPIFSPHAQVGVAQYLVIIVHSYAPTCTHRGIIGSGLCVFSRYPIAFVCAHRFTVNGSVTEIKDGEIFAGKSIMLCRIHTSAGDIAFYNTHVS